MFASRQGGFTLWELLVGLAVAAMILSYGLPALARQIRHGEMLAAERAWVRLFQRARHRAVTLGTPVAFCHLGAEGRCVPTERGRTVVAVFEDADADGRIGPGERILWMDEGLYAPEDRGWSLRLTGSFRDGGIYLPDGRAIRPGGAFLAGSVRLCSPGLGRRIVLNRTGRVRVEAERC